MLHWWVTWGSAARDWHLEGRVLTDCVSNPWDLPLPPGRWCQDWVRPLGTQQCHRIAWCTEKTPTHGCRVPSVATVRQWERDTRVAGVPTQHTRQTKAHVGNTLNHQDGPVVIVWPSYLSHERKPKGTWSFEIRKQSETQRFSQSKSRFGESKSARQGKCGCRGEGHRHCFHLIIQRRLWIYKIKVIWLKTDRETASCMGRVCYLWKLNSSRFWQG